MLHAFASADITVGSGAEAKVGERVAIHYDVKFRNITFMTSRQGIGVTGGNPLGFDVGQPAGSAGSTLPGIDLVSSNRSAVVGSSSSGNARVSSCASFQAVLCSAANCSMQGIQV
jgi:hypothetical protein